MRSNRAGASAETRWHVRTKLFACGGGEKDVESVCQPVWNGRKRHPVVFPGVAWRKLAVSDARDLKEFLADFVIAGCELEDEGLGLHIGMDDTDVCHEPFDPMIDASANVDHDNHLAHLRAV